MKKLIHRIAVFGDSVLKGTVFDENKGRYCTLEDNCARLTSQRLGIDIANHSRFGCTAPRGKTFVLRAVQNGMNCDAALIEYGGNDCDFDWAQVASAPDQPHQPHTLLRDFIAAFRDMITSLRQKGIAPVLMNLPPIDSVRYFDWITRDGLSRSNILNWLGDVHYIYRFHEQYSLAVANLALEQQCPLIDVRSAFLQRPDYNALLCADGIHPNKQGHQMMLRTILDYVYSHELTGQTSAGCPAS